MHIFSYNIYMYIYQQYFNFNYFFSFYYIVGEAHERK